MIFQQILQAVFVVGDLLALLLLILGAFVGQIVGLTRQLLQTVEEETPNGGDVMGA